MKHECLNTKKKKKKRQNETKQKQANFRSENKFLHRIFMTKIVQYFKQNTTSIDLYTVKIK